MADASSSSHGFEGPRPTGLPRSVLLAAGLGVGLATDRLLWEVEAAGLNFLLFFVALAIALGLVSRAAGLRPSAEAVAWVATGLLLATGFVLRASPQLQLLAFLGAAAAFAFPALRAGAAWARGSGVSDQVEAIVGAIAHAGFGTLWLVADAASAGGSAGAAATSREPEGTMAVDTLGQFGRLPLRAVLLGLVLAAPLLFVFGALFMSADRVFASIVTDLVELVALDELAAHLLVIGVVGWLASGYLVGFVKGTRMREWVPADAPRPVLGIVEVGTALAAIDLLFAAFVLVQLRYLFGGSGLVEVTPGLTYAEYAREGFAQLVLATALVLPCLLASDWVLRREAPRDSRVFRLLGGLQLLLLAVVIASAVQRLRAYLDAYGLTESRFYGVVFLGWLALLAVWFAATVLRGRRERFAFPALASGFVVVVVLFLANPDARIAGANLERAGSPAYAASFDATYLGSLSADAVPTLMRGLPALGPADRCTLARSLLRKWGEDEARDWRAWNASAASARRAVEEERSILEAATNEPACPPEG